MMRIARNLGNLLCRCHDRSPFFVLPPARNIERLKTCGKSRPPLLKQIINLSCWTARNIERPKTSLLKQMYEMRFYRFYHYSQWSRDHVQKLMDADVMQLRDWSFDGNVVPIKNQYFLNSCWAVGFCFCVESRILIHQKIFISLSIQELLETFSLPWLKEGASNIDVHNHARLYGLLNREWTNRGFVSSRSTEDLFDLINTGPVVVVLNIDDSFQDYKGGIFFGGRFSKKSTKHCVVATGYGCYKGVNFMVVANTWGRGFGMDGYIFIEENVFLSMLVEFSSPNIYYPFLRIPQRSDNWRETIDSSKFQRLNIGAMMEAFQSFDCSDSGLILLFELALAIEYSHEKTYMRWMLVEDKRVKDRRLKYRRVKNWGVEKWLEKNLGLKLTWKYLKVREKLNDSVLWEIAKLIILADLDEDQLIDYKAFIGLLVKHGALISANFSDFKCDQPCDDNEPMEKDSKLPKVTNVEYDEHKGRIAIGHLHAGVLQNGMDVRACTSEDSCRCARVSELFMYEKFIRVPAERVEAGDICAVCGLDDIQIGETIADKLSGKPLPSIKVEEPTVKMAFSINTSPFVGREGKYVTSRNLRDRLYRELERNLAMKVEDGETADAFIVSERGTLHITILIENMRREGYEFMVGPPKVINKKVDGKVLEPYEIATVEVPEVHMGSVVELLGKRHGQMFDMQGVGSEGTTLLKYKIPTRGFLGLRNAILTASRGTAILNTIFDGYGPWAGVYARSWFIGCL